MNQKSPIALCDEDCNHCPIILHPNSRMITRVLNELQEKFGDAAYQIVQGNCPNLTCCYDCRIDDFCHSEDCDIIKGIEEHPESQFESLKKAIYFLEAAMESGDTQKEILDRIRDLRTKVDAF